MSGSRGWVPARVTLYCAPVDERLNIANVGSHPNASVTIDSQSWWFVDAWICPLAYRWSTVMCVVMPFWSIGMTFSVCAIHCRSARERVRSRREIFSESDNPKAAHSPLPRDTPMPPSTKKIVHDLFVGDDVLVREVDCKSIVDTTTTVRQQKVHGSADIDYSKATDICCWHCCHKFDGLPIPLPHMYDQRNKTFAVFGVFCSFSCAKSYLIEHSRFDGGHHVLLLKAMGLQVYNMNVEQIIEAPPRIDLAMFGGTMTIEEFRVNETLRLAETPPFVPYTTIIEERSHRSQHWNLEGMRRPETQSMQVSSQGERGMYFEFLKKQDDREADDGSAPAAPPTTKGATGPSKASSLHRFMKVRPANQGAQPMEEG